MSGHRGTVGALDPEYDVVICGAGLAGLTLARLLSRRLPALSVALLDKTTRPLPEACHKVGESVVEGGTHWLRHTLGLAEYLDERHVPKLGLRFFGASSKDFSTRFEVGAPQFPAVPSVQLDRGRFENDLRAMTCDDGVALLEGATVTAIDLGTGAQPHRVHLRTEAFASRSIACRWLVDATGFRRMLAAKHGLDAPLPLYASACWWRVRGRYEPRIDRPRPIGPARWYSTNHILGHGYWIWMIALASEHTSIGIVADESLHPLAHRRDFAAAQTWLARHEPALAELLAEAKAEDFGARRRYSRRVTEFTSADRWAMVGASAMFSDPLYASGTDMIAWMASLTVRLIEQDVGGALEADQVEASNRLTAAIFDLLHDSHRHSYAQFHNDAACLLKYVWDGVVYFTFAARGLLQEVAFDPMSVLSELRAQTERAAAINRRVQLALSQWAAARPGEAIASGYYFPGRGCPSLRSLTLTPAMAADKESPDAFIAWQQRAAETLESVAEGIEALAAEAIDPDAAPRLSAAARAHAEELRAFLGQPWTP